MKPNSKNPGTILIVDDDAFARYKLQLVLKRESFQVVETESGIRELALASTYRTQVAL